MRHRLVLSLALASACAGESTPPDPPASSPDAAVSADAAPGAPDAEPFDPCAVDPDSRACRGDPPPYTGTHPLDALLHRTFWLEGHTPVEASAEELCQRMALDLIGRSLSVTELARECAGRTPEQLAAAFQARPEYLVLSERHWRDRLAIDDVSSDWRYNKALFARVDALHQGALRYDAFVPEVLAHPAFVLGDVQAEDRVRRAFRAFFGREASDVEAAELAALYRPWVPVQEVDPDFRYIYRFGSTILPGLCQPLFRCQTSALGGGRLDLGVMGFDAIRWEDLTADQRSRLQELGRLFVRQPMLWESAADDILARLLGWSDGGRFPREPGILLPEVRDALARILRETGDYPAAERLVMTSWLYRQTARVAPDGRGDDPSAPVPPPYHSGPVKARSAEAWLDSASAVTTGLGTCDPRYSDGFAYILMYQAAQTGTITMGKLEEDVAALWVMQENRQRLTLNADLGINFPDFAYSSIARLMGGCPGFQDQRQSPEGIAYAYGQESVAELLCTYYDLRARPITAPPLTVARLLTHQMGLVYGREPLPEEIAEFEAAYMGCAGTECSEAQLVKSTCSALLGSAEALFY